MSHSRDRSAAGGLRGSGSGKGGAAGHSAAFSRSSPTGSVASPSSRLPLGATNRSPSTGAIRRSGGTSYPAAGKPSGGVSSPGARRSGTESPVASLQPRLAAASAASPSPSKASAASPPGKIGSRSYSRTSHSFSGPTSTEPSRKQGASSSPAKAGPTSPTKSSATGVPSDISSRRRRLSQTYGGAAPDPADLVSPAPTPQTIHEHMRELGFSVLTTAMGMDTDRSTQVGQCKLTYSCATHPGSDPGGFQKDNQDAWVVKENFGNRRGIFFGVFDGHGYEGRKVSHAIVNRLPKMLSGSEAFKEGKFKDAALKMCVECNNVIKRLHAINSDLSGSTGIMAYLHPDGAKLTVVNVGDSRCILGKVVPGGTSEGVPLSTDHVPTVVSEAARIRQFRGRIASFMHMGRPMGPLRVWLPDRDIPGLCMTRSFGDNVAASVGVISKPEITEVMLKDEDKYLILCSDGLTEFIGNDEMVSIVHKHTERGLTPQEIAKRLVKESRKRWQSEEDDVIDDCTIIVVVLNRVQGESAGANSTSPAKSSASVSSQGGVRRLGQRHASAS